MNELNELGERVGVRTVLAAIFVLGWIAFATSNWNLARRGRIDRLDRWVGLRYGWSWPVVAIGVVVLHVRDLWKARE